MIILVVEVAHTFCRLGLFGRRAISGLSYVEKSVHRLRWFAQSKAKQDDVGHLVLAVSLIRGISGQIAGCAT
jgi:hypothetical protein